MNVQEINDDANDILQNAIHDEQAKIVVYWQLIKKILIFVKLFTNRKVDGIIDEFILIFEDKLK